MEQRAIVSNADIRKKDRDIRNLRGNLQKESDKFKHMIEKYQHELMDMQSVSYSFNFNWCELFCLYCSKSQKSNDRDKTFKLS